VEPSYSADGHDGIAHAVNFLLLQGAVRDQDVRQNGFAVDHEIVGRYPKAGASLNAAALVWSNAPAIIGAHDAGPLIRSKDGFWLAIPTAAAGKGARGGRITPGEWERRRGLRLRFVYRRTGPSLLVAEGRLNARGVGVASRSQSLIQN
jgi:hypothetical protein